MKTKTGKTRLGPLNLTQLNDMLEKAKPKNRSKIQNRIRAFTKKFSSTISVEQGQ